MSALPLVLASGSPRRRQLLEMLGIPHDVAPVGLDETRLPDEPPDSYATRLAGEKALAGARQHPGRWVLGADTIVVLDEDVGFTRRSRGDAGSHVGKAA